MKPSEQLPDQVPENKAIPRRAFLAASAALSIAHVLGCEQNDPYRAYADRITAQKQLYRKQLDALTASREQILNSTDQDDMKRKALEALLVEVQALGIDPAQDVNYYFEAEDQFVLEEAIKRDIDLF